jgi:hypothetical protein
LEDLAKAIVLRRHHYDSSNSTEAIRRERTAKQLKQLRFREKMRNSYRKIANTLRPVKQLVLSSLDVPDSHCIDRNYGDCTQPKTWKGPWKTLTDHEQIARAICQVSIAQYNQAMLTPFGSGPLADKLGKYADTNAADRLLLGNIPPISPHPLPKMLRLLQTLTTHYPSLFPDDLVDISQEEFFLTY